MGNKNYYIYDNHNNWTTHVITTDKKPSYVFKREITYY
jgi:hypothetical protein